MSNIPINLDLEVPSGDDYTIPIVISNSDGTSDVDFSLYKGFFTLKTSKSQYSSDADAIYQLSTVDGDFSITSSGAPLSTYINIPSFARSAALYTSAPLKPNSYYWDLQLVSPANKVATWFRGKYKVTWHSTVGVE